MRQKIFTQWLLLAVLLFMGMQGTWAETTYKLTQVTLVSAGNKYVLVEGTHALLGTITSNAVQSTTSFNTTGLTGSENYIWTLQSATGGFYMKMKNGKYLNNKSGTDMVAENSGTSIWAFAFTDGVALITNKSNGNRFIGNDTHDVYKAYVNDAIGLAGSSHDFTVYLVEEETPSYTVICHIGDNTSNVEREESATLSLDDPSPIGNMSFAGWSSSNDVASPVWVSNSATVTGNMELYAFFTITDGVYSLGKSKSVTISAAKYATYCSDEGLNFSETGAKVYTAKVTDGVVKLTEIESGIVPANTGFMIYKDVAATEELSVPVQKTDATVSNNELVGVTEKTAVPWTDGGKYNYILQKKAGDDKAKFYKATGANLIANRAYLSTTYHETTEGRGLEILLDGEEGDVSGISEMKRTRDAVNEIFYNLNGLHVAQPTQKGIYVVNGKKFVVK